MLKGSKVLKFGQRTPHSLSPICLNASTSNESARKLGLFNPISAPVRIMDSSSKETKHALLVIPESQSKVSDSEKKAREREHYKAYREYLERRRKEIISPQELKQTLEKAEETYKTFSRYS